MKSLLVQHHRFYTPPQPIRRVTSPSRITPRVVPTPTDKDLLIDVLNLMAANLNIDLRYFLVSWLDLKQNEAFYFDG